MAAKKTARKRQKKHQERGAFQLSLSFIIVVVFAIVLLSFAIQWLQGTIFNIEDLTEDLIQEAELKLTETFQQSQQNFAIWPPEASPYDVTAGTRMAVVAGIKNNVLSATGQQFSAHINFVDGSGPLGTPTENAAVEGWIKTGSLSTSISHLDHGTIPLIIEIPASNVREGTYTFKITACSDATDSGINTVSECAAPTNYLWGGSTKFFVLNVVS